MILRSSDNIDFRVHKVVMSDASSVFEAMFALPQGPAAEPPEAEPTLTLAVVPLPESSSMLELVLGVLYPGKGPSLDSPHRIGDVLAVADKYAMDGVMQQMRFLLQTSRFLDDRCYCPLSILAVYGLARRYNFESLAADAARASLKKPLPEYTLTGLNAMTVAHYYDLVSYRDKCVKLFDAYMPDDDLGDKHEDDLDWDDIIEDVWGDEYEDGRFQTNSRTNSEIVLLNLSRCDCRGRLWFRLHLHRLKEAFSKSVCGASLQDPELVDKTVVRIEECDSCMREAPMEILEFNKRLGEKLDRELDDASPAVLNLRRFWLISSFQVDFWCCVLK